MTDYPPDLIETLVKASPTASRVVLGGEYGVRMHSDEEAVRIVLDVLVSWCDGDLFDPATGQRFTAGTGHWPNHHCTVHYDCADDLDTYIGWCVEGSKRGDCNLVPTYTLTRKDQT